MTGAAYIDGRPLAVDLPLHVTEVPGGTRRGSDRPTFLLLHGFGASSFTWRHWAPRLAERGRVLCVDYKGFGAAPKPPDGAYGPHDQADLIVALIDTLRLGRVTLIGHSLGGGISLLVAIRMAARRESPLERLVLVSAPAYRQRLPPFVALSKRPRMSATLLSLLGVRRVIRVVIRSIVWDRNAVTDEQVAAYARPLEEPDGVRAMLDAGRQIVPPDIDTIGSRIPRVTIPTLLLWGRYERVVPVATAERLATELPDARLVVLEQCGHVPPEERPEESYAAVSAFLDDTAIGAEVAPDA